MTTRRNFMKTSSLAGVGVWTATQGLCRADKSPNEKLNIGAIGVGGRGEGDLRLVSHENIVAICDVDLNRLGRAGERHSKAKQYSDYRQLLQQDNLDAVVVATPDHHHAVATIRALKRGLHVYCEKPLTHTVQEARLIAEEAAKQKVATQMGTQNHEHPGYLRTVELLQSGVIGGVHEVHIITDRPGRFWAQGLQTPTTSATAPKHLKWDTWLGPAKHRDYNEAYAPFRWRGWWDFGCGAIGDMAIHLMDPSFWALKLGGPVKVSAMGSPALPDNGPTWMIVHFEFGQRGDLPPCSVYWYEGVAQAPIDIAKSLPMNGSLFIGEKGRIAVQHDKFPQLLPEEKFKDQSLPESYLPKSPGHHQQWINACKNGTPTSSNFGYAGPFTEIVLLGNVAYRSQATIAYDPAQMKITNHDAANELLSKEYRRGWEI